MILVLFSLSSFLVPIPPSFPPFPASPHLHPVQKREMCAMQQRGGSQERVHFFHSHRVLF